MIFLQLCVLKIEDDCLPALEILGLLMNPSWPVDIRKKNFSSFFMKDIFVRYHQSNHSRLSDLPRTADQEVFASLNEYRIPQRVRFISLNLSLFIFSIGLASGFHQSIWRSRWI